MANKSKLRREAFLELCLSDLVQTISQKLIEYGENLKCTEFDSKGNKRREGFTVQARILDARSVLGASRSVRIEGGSKEKGGQISRNPWKISEKLQKLQKGKNEQ